jgi:YbgC/YbaW family acyl-CoA thioester hydrolase
VSVHTTRIRPLFADTDAAGVVYYGAYLRLLEEARTQALESVGLDVRSEYALGRLYPVTHIEVDYQASAPYGSVVCITTEVAEIGRVRFRLEHRLYLEDDQTPIGRATVRLACLDGLTRRAVRLSPAMADALMRLREDDCPAVR